MQVRKIIFIVSLLIFSLSVNAREFQNIDQAIEDGKRNNRLVVITAYANSCRYCHLFVNNLKADPYYYQFTQEYNYVIADIKENLELFAKFFAIEVTPTTYIIDPNQMEYYIPEIKGNVAAEEVFEYLSKVKKYLNK